MADSPAASTPYEVLGVSPTASQDELRLAYRRMLRETHPDTGGDAARFHAVQEAWERVGDPDRRRDYDRGRMGPAPAPRASGPASTRPASGAPRRPAGGASGPRTGSPLARSYGYPGGRARTRFRALMQEWAGRGTTLTDPYDPALVRRAPREIRLLLAKAVAEETTAQQISTLGIGYTIWNAVAGWSGDYQIDHVVLGPAGLFAVHSADWGTGVRLARGEVAGDERATAEEPVKTLVRNARRVAKDLGVRFTGYPVVVPDEDAHETIETVSRGKNAGACLVARSALPAVLRGAIGVAAGRDAVVAADVFEVRTRLQHGLDLL